MTLSATVLDTAPTERPLTAARSLPTIHMFWHGAPLSRIERLAIASFVKNGHCLDLYVYDEPAGVPAGARLKDAGEILPRDALFRHRRTQSLAAFADWFRYRLLFERGGIWVDADMVCLKPFDYENPEIYAWQDDRYINNAVLGLPPGHALAEWLAACCENPNRMRPYDSLYTRLRKLRRRFLRGNQRSDVSWGENGPKGLTRAAHHLGYAAKALPSWHFYPVGPDQCRELFESPLAGKPVDFATSRAVHLWNQLLKERAGLDKNSIFPADSPFERMYARYVGEG